MVLDVGEAITRQVCEAEFEDRRIMRIRVTSDALARSVVAVPLGIEGSRSVEILVHTSDWQELLTEAGYEITTIYGIPVAVEL